MNRLRRESGAPIADNQNSQSAGPGGPLLLQDQHLVEKLARFNRERIPERVVHAVGSGAYGTFVVTNHGCDGSMQFDAPPRDTENYEPNSIDGPSESGEPHYKGLATAGVSGTTVIERHAEDCDCVQAGALYRVMLEDE